MRLEWSNNLLELFVLLAALIIAIFVTGWTGKLDGATSVLWEPEATGPAYCVPAQNQAGWR